MSERVETKVEVPGDEYREEILNAIEGALAEMRQMHACVDAIDDVKHVGLMWAVTWLLAGFTLGVIFGAVFLT